MPPLVDSNPQIAAALVRAILRLAPRDVATAYLLTLANADLSLQTLETVNLIATGPGAADTIPSSGGPGGLPADYLAFFVGVAMSQCERAGTRDKHAQTRLVKLLCVFIQSLMRNGLLQRRSGGATMMTVVSGSGSGAGAGGQGGDGADPFWKSADDNLEVLLESIETFCVSFSMIKEATVLYKALKGGNGNGG